MTIIELIKKFINWLIELIKGLFGKKKKKKKIKCHHEQNIIENKKTIASINGVFDSTLPVYMIISETEKEKLVYSIGLMKNVLMEKNSKIKETEEKELVALIENKCGIKVSEIIDDKYIDTIVKDLNTEDKKEIINKYRDITKRDIEFKKHVSEIDKTIKLINENDISIITADEIDREISNIVNDKSNDELDQKIDDFNIKVFEIVEDFDKDFIKEVVKEYKTVNYVTIATTILDRNYERFKKIEEDFKNHRFNRYYYEREINKIKRELQEIRDLKNKKEVREHIEKLKKELYTKSKDKYDLLYNNEVFVDITKRCDMLLDKVNTKVVDIRKEEKKVKKEKDEKEERKEDELEEIEYDEEKSENIILRFQDLSLANRIILFHRQMQIKKMTNSHVDEYLDDLYNEFLKGVDGPFNYESNRVKTELANLINDLDGIIARKENRPPVVLEHSNFRMEDLVNGAIVRKEKIETEICHKESPVSPLVDEKLEKISEKYLEKKDEKVYTKRNRNAA